MYYTVFPSEIGKIFLAKTQKGLTFAHFLRKDEDIKSVLHFFKKKDLPIERNDNKFKLEKSLFSRYFSGKQEDFTSLSIDFLSGTPFQRKVWLETRKIPFGKTETYKSVALKMNNRGFRSIGQALSKNPILIVIPCHRVLCSDGSLGGFSAGLELKKFLLSLEKGGNQS